MSVVKQFQCETCNSEGKITIKGSEVQFEDIVYCPVCSGSIWEEEDSEELEE